MRKYFIALLLLPVLIAFQNCGGDGGGTVILDPLQEEVTELKLSSYNSSVTSFSMCLRSIYLRIIELEEALPDVSLDGYQYGIYTMPNGDDYLVVNFEQNIIRLNPDGTVLANLALPKGRYDDLIAETSFYECIPGSGWSSMQITNSFGQHNDIERMCFNFSDNNQVINSPGSNEVMIENFVQQYENVQSDQELNTLNDNLGYRTCPNERSN